MNFGEKFRTEHSSVSDLMSKSELDAYAEKLESKINESSFDKEHDTVFVKNSTLTNEQIDYLQLRLNIYIYRLNQGEIALNPFRACDIEANETKADIFMERGLPFIVACITELLLLCNIPLSFWSLLYSSILLNIVFILCIASLLTLIAYEFANLMDTIISNYRNKKYIKLLQESNEI